MSWRRITGGVVLVVEEGEGKGEMVVEEGEEQVEGVREKSSLIIIIILVFYSFFLYILHPPSSLKTSLVSMPSHPPFRTSLNHHE